MNFVNVIFKIIDIFEVDGVDIVLFGVSVGVFFIVGVVVGIVVK